MDLNSCATSRREACMESMQSIVYHPQLVAVYHQHEVLYIIKPQEDARWRVMRYKGGNPPLMIYAALRASMICQVCGLDKQKENFCLPKVLFLLAGAQGLLCLRAKPFRGSDSPLGCHSTPLPLRALH